MTDFRFASITTIMMIKLEVRLNNRPILLNSNGFLYACLNFWQIISQLEIVFAMSWHLRSFMNFVTKYLCSNYFCTLEHCRFCHLLCNSFDLFQPVVKVIIVMNGVDY